ncbi:MAG: DNA-directed RNA polymerase subunit omega [Planctomycetales bacterium 4484_113]|nr:MAG: DNA-directed RNA polymerase subunit omega [Planctomycetales bacterium 4484_113]
MDKDKNITERDTLLYPLLEDLLQRIPSKFEVVVLASLRAREIMRKQKLGASFDGELDADVVSEQETLKPLSRALADIAEGKLDREKMYLLEYLESFRRGDEDIAAPPVLEEDSVIAQHPSKEATGDLPLALPAEAEASASVAEEELKKSEDTDEE